MPGQRFTAMLLAFAVTSSSKIVKNSTVLGAYFVVEVGLTFVFTLVLARFLGASEFGRISFALSYALVTSVVADAGLTFSLAKLIPRAGAEARDVIGGAFTLRLMFTCLVLLASGVLFWFFPYMRANVGLLLVILLSEHIRSFALMVCSVFRGFQQMIYEPLILGSERVLLLVGAYLLLSSGYGVKSIALLYLCARGFSLAVALTLLFRKVGTLRLGIERERVSSILSESLPLAIFMTADRVNQAVGPLLLTLLVSETATGIFQAAFKLAMLPMTFTATIGGSLFPAMAANFQEEKSAVVSNILHYGVKITLHLFLPFAVLTVFLADPLVHLIYGAGFEASAQVLPWLTPYYLFNVFFYFTAYALPAVDRQRTLARLSLGSIVLTVALGVLFVHHWQEVGAAMGLSIASLILAAAGIWQMAKSRLRVLSPGNVSQLAALVPSIVIAFALRVFGSPVILSGIAIGLVFYVSLFCFGGFSQEEKLFVRHLSTRILNRTG